MNLFNYVPRHHWPVTTLIGVGPLLYEPEKLIVSHFILSDAFDHIIFRIQIQYYTCEFLRKCKSTQTHICIYVFRVVKLMPYMYVLLYN